MSKPPVRRTPATPLGHLKSIELTAGGCARNKDAKRFTKYLRSPELAESLGAIDADMRERAFRSLVKAMLACESRYPAIPKAGTVRVKAWDDAMIAKLRDAEKRFGNDDAIARHLGLPIKVVRPARWKFCGPRQPRTRQNPQQEGGAREHRA